MKTIIDTLYAMLKKVSVATLNKHRDKLFDASAVVVSLAGIGLWYVKSPGGEITSGWTLGNLGDTRRCAWAAREDAFARWVASATSADLLEVRDAQSSKRLAIFERDSELLAQVQSELDRRCSLRRVA